MVISLPHRISSLRHASPAHQISSPHPVTKFYVSSLYRVGFFLTSALVFCLLFQNNPSVALAAETDNESPSPISVSISVDGYEGVLPTLIEGKDFTAGQPIKANPRFMVDDQGTEILADLIEEKESQGYQLVWYMQNGTPFDWFSTPVSESIQVTGSFQQADFTIRISFNGDQPQDLEVAVPKGSSFEQAYGSIPQAPEKEGYSFERWVNSADNSTFDFSAPVQASTTVYALYRISEPDKVVTVDADIDVPETATGQCYIGATWSVHPAKFSLSGFTGELEGCSGTGICSLASAAAPSYTWADYIATLKNVDLESGTVTYEVTITPPGAAHPGGPSNSLGLIGYQTISFEATIQKNFGGYIELQKKSENPDLSSDNQTYTLKDALFGIYDKAGKRVAELKTDASGKSDRSPLLPVGTYTIKEEKAPQGYANTADKTIEVEAGSVTKATIFNTPQSSLIDLVLTKLDAETGQPYPLGSASLKGAQFRISYYDSYPDITKLVKNAAEQASSAAQNSHLSSAKTIPVSEIPSSWEKAKRSWVFETDKEGKIAFTSDYLVEGDPFYYDLTGSIVLPLGSVVIEEVKAPQGYLLNGEPLIVCVPEKGTEAHVESWQQVSIPEQVKRGDLSFTKVREGSMEHLANVPFRITSQTTQESHLLITDENGMASTASSWVAHSQNTNAATSWQDGIWFGVDTQGNTTPVNDTLGALPYDTYLVEEMPCSANEGMKPVSFKVTISRDHTTLDLGTIDNAPYDPPIEGEVDKRQTLLDENGKFAYTIDYRSTSTTWADEYTVTDQIVCAQNKQAFLEGIITPVSFNDYDGKMNIWYRTNKDGNQPANSITSSISAESDTAGQNEIPNACESNPYNPDNPNNERQYDFTGWHLWKQDVSTQDAQALFVDELTLDDDEWICALAFEHGRVEEGFGTLPAEASEWQNRERYEEYDTWNEALTCESALEVIYNKRPYSFTTAQTAEENETPNAQERFYSPAILFLQATQETLGNKQTELCNDAFIDIYRNIELHDEDKDSVVQTPGTEPIPKEENPLTPALGQLPKTGDVALGSIAALGLLAAISALCIWLLRGTRKR